MVNPPSWPVVSEYDRQEMDRKIAVRDAAVDHWARAITNDTHSVQLRVELLESTMSIVKGALAANNERLSKLLSAMGDEAQALTEHCPGVAKVVTEMGIEDVKED